MAPASDRIPPTTHTSSSSEEREECSDPAVPRLSKGNTSCRSKDQGSPRGTNLYYRTYEQKRILEERLQAERETKQKEEMNHVTGRPLITKRAAKMVPKGALFAERASLWYERVQAKREKLEARLRDEERSTASFTPTLNDERNKRIAQRGYIGPVQGWEQHFARYCAKKNVEDNPRSLALNFKPSINKASHVERTTVHTNVPASERLYQNAKHLHEKHEEAVRAMRAAPLRDPCTGNELFRPSTNRSSSRDRASKPRDPDDVTKLLYEQHEILKKKKEELVAQARKQRTFPFKPTIDQHSVSLLEKVERPPLYLSPSRQQPSTSAEGRAKDASCDKHRSASTELPPKRKPINVGKFLQRAEFTQRQREHMLSALRELAEAREAQECTFTPHISETSERIFDASLYQRTGLTPSLIAPPGASSTARKWSSTQSYQDPKSLNRELVSSYDLQIPKTSHSPNPAPRHEPNKLYRQTVYQPNTNRRADTRSLSPGGKILEAMNTKSLAGSLGGSVTLHAHGNVSDFENEMSHVLHQWKAVEGETSGNLSHRW